MARGAGEVCVAEIFGGAPQTTRPKSAWACTRSVTGAARREEFATERLEIDVSDLHTCRGLATRIGGIRGRRRGVRRLNQAPNYPLQLMIGVFDFPARAAPGDDVVPSMVVTGVRGRP